MTVLENDLLAKHNKLSFNRENYTVPDRENRAKVGRPIGRLNKLSLTKECYSPNKAKPSGSKGIKRKINSDSIFPNKKESLNGCRVSDVNMLNGYRSNDNR